MAEKSLSERLADSRGQPIEYEGRTVHGIYRREVHPGDMLVVRFLRSTSEVREGLSLSMKKGVMLLEGGRVKNLILWTDTAPEIVEIHCQPPKDGAMLQLWNSWDQEGILQAWLGNAGMLIEEKDDSVVLRCSDGVGGPDFEDLVVELKFVALHETNNKPDPSEGVGNS